ncbi:MAG: zinc transport system ATP-binding protein [Actinomycetota bacterium]|nr:zinc transport system ATP-binding protein [Actinomycetota bacterium]
MQPPPDVPQPPGSPGYSESPESPESPGSPDSPDSARAGFETPGPRPAGPGTGPGAGPGDAMLVLRGAQIGYTQHPTVRSADLTIRRNEVVALIGPNGSGKSTLVRGVLGLARVLGGEVELFGLPASRFRERHRIGYVPQRHTVGGGIPSTVHEVVCSGRLPRRRWALRSNREDRAAVAAAIETVDLTAQTKVPVAHLSGGQQRRVLIARALASEPEIMIMDEPTAGVDVVHAERLVKTLSTLVDNGLTLLIVTHEVHPLRNVLTRVVGMDGGRITLDVPADRLLSSTAEAAHPLLAADAHAVIPPTDLVAGWMGTTGIGG